MPREIIHHGEVLSAIAKSNLISELLESYENHLRYELDLELIVYGRPYADKRVGPYAALMIYGSGEEIIQEGDWGGNSFYILIEGELDVYVRDLHGVSRQVNKLKPQASFGEMS